MGCALLSRFDLVFILLDKPDEQMDNLLSDHVMSLHSRQHRCDIIIYFKKNVYEWVIFNQVFNENPGY